MEYRGRKEEKKDGRGRGWREGTKKKRRQSKSLPPATASSLCTKASCPFFLLWWLPYMGRGKDTREVLLEVLVWP